ncbi:unnamed protein product [Blepharisma stoltei]|uniref:Uncharacterized protein n=1 Tax=Blepharisma stoltei TaxID=1481888 RepID=A0AAU9IEH7_9CILI|nr:unnamed protein product [Blepharisma stoltei]
MSGRCFKDGCTNQLYGMCECEGITLFCKDHGFEHLGKPTSKGHRYLQLCFKPAEEIKQPIIAKLIALKEDIKNYKIDALINANTIIKNFKTTLGRYIDQINEVEARINKMLTILYSGEEVLDIAKDDDMESVLKLNASDAQWKMNVWDIKECCLDYKDINAAISKTYWIPFNPFMQPIEDIIEWNELSFFRHNSSNFATINLDTFQISSTTTLPTQESINGYTTSCILPDYTYFYCCNNNTSSGLVFTIDKNKNVKYLQNSKVNHYTHPIFYNNFIYLIGGRNNLAERYDFKRNVWESMAPLPQGLNFTYGCNALYRDLILITSYYIQKIIIYSITQNNYQEVPNLLLNASYKLMLRGNKRVYLFEKGGRTFESAENNVFSWTQIGTNSNTGDLNQSSAVRYKGCLYFVVYPNQLWKFDLSSKQASQVATV